MAKEELPERFHMDDPGITWRYGNKPDYTAANKKYMAEKTVKHKAGSLEKLIENIVKTWEMEATHKPNIEDWGTVDPDKYELSVNGGKAMSGRELIRIGTYNALLAACPAYKDQSFQDSMDLFHSCFSEGFAWELVELYSGPPSISFKWHHWSNWTGPYGDVAPTGQLLELFGAAFVRVNADNKIEKLDIFYDPNPFLLTLNGGDPCPAQNGHTQS